jgi:hypothetical protein
VATREEYLDIADQALREGDEATAMAAMDEAEKLGSQVQQPAYPDVPTPENLAQGYYAQPAPQQPKERSMLDRIKGAGEVALALGSGATTGLAGGLAGGIAGIGQSIKQGTFGTSEGADRAQMVAEQSMAGSTYSPRTEAGQEYLQRIGEALSPLESLPPVGVNQLTGKVAAIPQAQRLAKKPEFKIDESLIYDNPEDAQRAALNRAVPVTKRIDPKNPEKQINDDLAVSAIRQGFNENFVQTLKGLSPADKKQVLKMATTIDRGESDFLASRYNRPSDVVGQSLSDRIDYIKSVNKKAGVDVDKAVKSLPESVDPTAPFESTLSSLVDMGVKFDNDQVPSFKGSEVQGFAADERIIKNVVERMNEINTAKDLHNLKKYIYNSVYAGKRSEGGLQPKTERVLKDFARGINETLGEASPDYRAANTVYSETIDALDELQSAAGKSINLFGEGAEKSLGTSVRGLLSNNKTRVELENQINNIDSVAKKYGGNFQDDIRAQTAIVDELEKIYQTQGKTSLGGEVGKQAQEIINKGVRGALTDKAFSMISKSEKQRRQDSLKALKKLLMREDQ